MGVKFEQNCTSEGLSLLMTLRQTCTLTVEFLFYLFCLELRSQTERDSMKLRCETLQAELEKNSQSQVFAAIM